MGVHWNLGRGKVVAVLVIESSMYDTSGVLALAGHDRRAPISGELMVE